MTDDESAPVMMQWKGLDKRREPSTSSNMDMDLAPPPPSPPPPKRIKQLEEEEDHKAMDDDDDDDEDQYQGSQLMELLSVQLIFPGNDHFYGKITIRDRFGEQTVYEGYLEHGEPVRDGEFLLLTGPKKRCVRADGKVIIEAETKDGLHLFEWSPDIFGPSFGFYPMYGLSTRHTISVGHRSTTKLTLEYVVYRVAVQAVVSVRLIDDGCGGDGGAIFGSISAWNCNVDDNESMLFKEESGGKGTRVLHGKLIQLSRSLVSVPLDGSLLTVEADLLSYGNNGKDAVVIAKGRASFDPWYFGSERVDSSGGCGKIRVRVTWKCSPSDPTSEDLSDVHDDRNGGDDDFEELGVWTDATPVDNGGEQQPQLPEPSASPQPLPEPDREHLLSDFKQNDGLISWPLTRDLFIRYRMTDMIGSMLAEVFEVRNGGVDGSFFGMIAVVVDAEADVIYCSDWENRAFVCADSSLPLAGPAQSIIAYKPFSIHVKLYKEEESSHGLERFEYRKHISWDPSRWDDCYKLLEEKVMGNDDGQPVIVKYTVFTCAIQATVEVWLKLCSLGRPKIALDINGSVTARYNKYFSNSSMPLFEKSFHEPIKLALAFGDPIPLRRSVVSVPLDSLLIVEANLRDGIANGVDEIDNGLVSGKAEFVPRCIGWFQEKTIAGAHGEILVRVSWKSYAL